MQVIPLIIKVLSKSMDSSLAPDKVELATVTRSAETGKVVFKVFDAEEMKPLLDAANAAKEAENEDS
jgi:20S proteasome subunit alpha 3